MRLVEQALGFGFSQAAELDVKTLRPLEAVRDMCAADKCGLYGRCWTCPPACGSIVENAVQIANYRQGILVQTTRSLDDDFDHENMKACEETHKALFIRFRDHLQCEYPHLLALGAGGCRRCVTCTYPGAPCRMPDKAISSMEAYGLLVSDVCVKNSLAYYYGVRTITFTGCFLLL